MNGFGFIQYDNEADAKDVVPGAYSPFPFSIFTSFYREFLSLWLDLHLTS